MGAAIRLNLGSGDKYWPGFVNVDAYAPRADIRADLTDLPFEDGYADEVWAVHVIEHFRRKDTAAVLGEWVRVLRPGGRLVVECPCLDKIIQILPKWNKIESKAWIRLTLNGLYGDVISHDAMQHKWCFMVEELKELFREAGLSDVRYGEPEYHQPLRDMRISGCK